MSDLLPSQKKRSGRPLSEETTIVDGWLGNMPRLVAGHFKKGNAT